jgi:ABC-type dipeptide/oligopeptide/nickel transport system ATPase component
MPAHATHGIHAEPTTRLDVSMQVPSPIPPPPGCPFHNRCPVATLHYGVVRPELRQDAMRHAECHEA